MTKEELLEELADMLDVDVEELAEDTVLDDFEDWDSISALSVIALAKKEFDIKLSSRDVKGFETVGDIIGRLIG